MFFAIALRTFTLGASSFRAESYLDNTDWSTVAWARPTSICDGTNTGNCGPRIRRRRGKPIIEGGLPHIFQFGKFRAGPGQGPPRGLGDPRSAGARTLEVVSFLRRAWPGASQLLPTPLQEPATRHRHCVDEREHS